jgi:hypothetical protein
MSSTLQRVPAPGERGDSVSYQQQGADQLSEVERDAPALERDGVGSSSAGSSLTLFLAEGICGFESMGGGVC